MASLKERVSASLARLRARYVWWDHLLTMLSHYGKVNGGAQAGAVTYFGYLSVFPILLIAFFVVGLLAHVYPGVRADLVSALDGLLPGLIGSDSSSNEIPIRTIEKLSGTLGLVGLVGVLYSGLGWLSGMRAALEVMFVVPRREQPNLIFGKLRDLATLALIGVTLLVSVAVTGAVTGFTGKILDLVGINPDATVPSLVLVVIGHLLGIAASTALLLLMFKTLLADSHVPRRAMLSGAVLGAVGFEVLKFFASLLLAQTKGQPAFQAFGISLVLVVWINYFSRLVMYAAAWSYTAPDALAQRTAEAVIAPGAALTVGDPAGVSNPTESAPLGGSRAVTAPRPLLLAGVAALGAGVGVLMSRTLRR